MAWTEQEGENWIRDCAEARDNVPQSAPKFLPRPATRTMYVAYIWSINNIVMFDLEIKHCPMTFHIAMSMDDPFIKAFTDRDGQINELFGLQGTEARFHFRNFISNGWIEQTPITRIEKLTGNV